MLLFFNRCYIISLQINKRVVFAILGADKRWKGGSVFMLVSEWLNWMVSEKERFALGRSSAFHLPAISFSKRSRSFSLYFYLSKDSYISKVNFFYDGGQVLPTLVSDEGFADESFADVSRFTDEGPDADLDKSLALFLISNFFSFNLTNLKKAIHHKGKLYLSPKVASINSHFFGIKVSRNRSSAQLANAELTAYLEGTPLIVFIRSDVHLMNFITSSASSFDLSSFDDFFAALKKKCNECGYHIRRSPAFSAFRNLVLDFQ